MWKRTWNTKQACKFCLICSSDQDKKKHILVITLVFTSHHFSVGKSLIRPWGAAQIMAVTMAQQRWRFSLKFADLTLPFGSGTSTELADRVREPLLQGAHRASGAWGAGGRAAWCLRGQWRHRGGDATLAACCRVRVWREETERERERRRLLVKQWGFRQLIKSSLMGHSAEYTQTLHIHIFTINETTMQKKHFVKGNRWIEVLTDH